MFSSPHSLVPPPPPLPSQRMQATHLLPPSAPGRKRPPWTARLSGSLVRDGERLNNLLTLALTPSPSPSPPRICLPHLPWLYPANSNSSRATSLGYFAQALGSNSIAIGAVSKTTATATIAIGNGGALCDGKGAGLYLQESRKAATD